MRTSRLTILSCAALVLAACTTQRSTMSPSPAPAPELDVAERRPASNQGFSASAIKILDPRQLIRRAALELEVENVAQVPPRATTIATQMGGYVQQTRESTDRSVWVMLRVPSASLDAALDSLGT